jgi:gluconolactonase
MKRMAWVLVLAVMAGCGAPEQQVQNATGGAAAKAVVKTDPGLDAVVSADATVDKVAGDFAFLEGPAWVREGSSGYLLFSDLPSNSIRKWSPDGTTSVFLQPSGFTGTDASDVGAEIDNGKAKVFVLGSNGITLDSQNRVVFAAHGDRAIVRIEPDGKRTVLADRYQGKRLNSPNDLVYKSDGTLYFTDPPYGLRRAHDDPKKELAYQGLFMLKGGKLQVLTQDMTSPNGVVLSPDEKYLYVNDTAKGIVMRYEVAADDTVGNGKVFADMTADKAPGVPDGMKVDNNGNLYTTGPGGIWIFAPSGTHLGTILTPEPGANLAFGDADGKGLYITARTTLYRVRLNTAGTPPGK